MRIIGLDVGDKRIGVAKVDTKVKIAIPHGTILVDGNEIEEIARIARMYGSDFFVVGLPRNASGEETAQSVKSRDFASRLGRHVKGSKVRLQDESLTSVEAENRLKARGKPYQKSDIDAEAATIILQDLIEHFIQSGEDFSSAAASSPLVPPRREDRPSLKASTSTSVDSRPISSRSADSIPTASASSLTPPVDDFADISDQLLADIDPSLTDDVDSSSAAFIAAKIAEITSRLPSPRRFVAVIRRAEFPARAVARLRRLPHSLRSLNFASHFHRPAASPAPSDIPATNSTTSAPISRRFLRRPSFKSGQGIVAKIKRHPVLLTISALVVLLVASFGGAYTWYQINLRPLAAAGTCHNIYSVACHRIEFGVMPGTPAANIVKSLAEQKLIRSPLAFNLYLKFSGQSANLKAGSHTLTSAMSTPEIVKNLTVAKSKNVFSFMIKPGEKLSDIKKNLIKQGYGTVEIDAAFNRQYDHPILSSKPAEASLEGYLYGDTYEFFADAKVESIILRTLDEMEKQAKKHQLVEAYQARGLTFHQGLTLASIIQRETTTDHNIIAQIFEKRFKTGERLGSDVTVSYAVDLIDPKREIYTSNADRLAIDSPYNTRKNPGLPPTPIATPGIKSLLAVAHPADTDYLYFLTGDDHKMYYGKTSAEHEYNRTQFCRRLCAVGL